VKLLLMVLFFATKAAASPCQKAWGGHPKPLTVCRLEWQGDSRVPLGIELAVFGKKCGQEGGGLEDCAILRACGPGKGGDKGASVFKKTRSLSSYCSELKDIEVFSPSDEDSPRAYVVCEGVGKPKGIKLSSPDGKLTKLCPFPFMD
jgi:hypothetical protein